MTSPGSDPLIRKIQFNKRTDESYAALLTLPADWIREMGFEPPKPEYLRITPNGPKLTIEPIK